MELTGYTDKEVESLVTGLAEALHNDLTEPDEIPEAPEGDGMITQKGDLWILGRHRVVCGNSTDEDAMRLLLDGKHPEILLTDPPYCSGGFQESGKSVGSIGTKQSDGNGGQKTPTISSDNLSTRGYQTLMRGRPLRYRHKGGLHLHRLENVALFVGSGGGFGPCDPEYDRLE